jgi:putative transposase
MSNRPPGNADVPVGSAGRDADGDFGAPEWYSRGYLPHRDAAGLVQSVTFRLADSLPQKTLKAMDQELLAVPEDRRDVERRKQIEHWLDAGLGCCALRHPEVARYVVEAFTCFHGDRYDLHAWCVMPNHVHVLVQPHIRLATIIQGWKSYTARWILVQNERLKLLIPNPRRLWMREYWDRFIRDEQHYRNVLAYIHENPVKAGLCREAKEWRWSSAYPGNADVLVGPTERLTAPLDTQKDADGDVGAPTS